MSDDTPTTPTEPTPTEPSAGAEPETRRPEPKDPLRGSRTSGIWAAVVSLGVLLVLLVTFIAQNTQTVRVTFLGWDGQTSLAVTLLIAATAGLFLTAAAGTLRILQLRRRVRRDKRR